MSVTFPLPLASFWGWLPLESAEPRLVPQQDFSGLGSGRILAHDLASPLWRAEAQMAAMTLSEQRRFDAAMASLDGALGSFDFTPLSRRSPVEDPSGVALGAAAPEIHTVGEDNKSLRLSGLPAGYQLRAGDYLSFEIGGRNILHILAEDALAAGSGVTPLFEVRAHLRPGTATGLAVTLVDPLCAMKIDPQTYNPGRRQGAVRVGVSFECVQAV